MASDKALFYGGIENGKFLIDGQPIGDWVRMLKQSIIFVDSTVKASDLISLMKYPGDTASGQPGAVNGVSLRTSSGSIQVIRGGDVWGIPSSNATELAAGMERMRDLCNTHGIRWFKTAAGTSAQMILDSCKSIGPFTPSRWRPACYAAIHAGPMIHVSGGAQVGAHIDRRQAYLSEMAQPMPAGETYIMDGEIPAHRHVDKPGLVYCCVKVAHTNVVNQLPPLPIASKRGKMLYPVGEFRGIWPSIMLKEALESGEIEITKVYWSMRWTTLKPIFAPFVEKVSTLPKELAKPLYTRVWGKMSAQGGWVGTLESKQNNDIPSGDLYWVCKAKPQYANSFPPYHRPDVAAWIVGLNHANMVRSVRATKPETLIAAHVDALWSSDVQGCLDQCGDSRGEWKLEGTGQIRYYSQGRYYVNDGSKVKIGASGWDDNGKPPTLEGFKAWASVVREKETVRGWIDRPETTWKARSVAPEILGTDIVVMSGHSPADTDFWGARGVYRQKWQTFLENGSKPSSSVCKHGTSYDDCMEGCL